MGLLVTTGSMIIFSSTTFSNDGRYFYGINNSVVTGYYSTSLANPELTWESTENRNPGIDMTMLNRRIDLERGLL